MADAKSDSPKTVQPVKREFAFSRVAGATASDYAAVSGMAVAAFIVSVGSILALWTPWALVFPIAALVMATLAIYYIATSAGTQTGRNIALSAIAVALLAGGTGAVVQGLAWQQRRQDIATVRGLVQQAAKGVAESDWDSFYDQLADDLADEVPRGHWRYQWNRWRELFPGKIIRTEMSDRARFYQHDRLLVRVSLWIEPPEPGDDGIRKPYEIRLQMLYRRASATSSLLDDHDGHGHSEEHLAELAEHDHQQHYSPDDWRLVRVPRVLSLPPLPYPEPVVWPAPGKIAWTVVDKNTGVGHRLSTPVGQKPVPGEGETVEAAVALPPLVPQMDDFPPRHGWLTHRPSRPRRAHQHQH